MDSYTTAGRWEINKSNYFMLDNTDQAEELIIASRQRDKGPTSPDTPLHPNCVLLSWIVSSPTLSFRNTLQLIT